MHVYWVCHSQGKRDCVIDCYIILLLHWLNQWFFKTAKLFFEGRVLYFGLLMEVNHNQAFYDKYYLRCSYTSKDELWDCKRYSSASFVCWVLRICLKPLYPFSVWIWQLNLNGPGLHHMGWFRSTEITVTLYDHICFVFCSGRHFQASTLFCPTVRIMIMYGAVFLVYFQALFCSPFSNSITIYFYCRFLCIFTFQIKGPMTIYFWIVIKTAKILYRIIIVICWLFLKCAALWEMQIFIFSTMLLDLSFYIVKQVFIKSYL